jgi:hypothetical protein
MQVTLSIIILSMCVRGNAKPKQRGLLVMLAQKGRDGFSGPAEQSFL